MAATLVDSGLFPHHIPRNVQQPPHPTISFPVPPSPLELSAAQLAPLASQHHTSEYNQHKFGIQGCPVPYLPLSIQLPDYFDELQRRQIQCSQARSWWPCHRADSPAFVVLSPAGAQPQETIHLEEEIQAAIAQPLDNTPQGPYTHTPQAKMLLHPSIKTSSTHPINISSIVPPEILPLISSHLYLASSSTSRPPPVVFEVPRLLALDRLTIASFRHHGVRSYGEPNPYPTSRIIAGPLRTRSGVREALRAAINGGLSGIESKKIKRDTLSGIPSPTLLQRPASTGVTSSQAKLTTLHSNTSSVSLSLSLSIAETSPTSTLKALSKGTGPKSIPAYSFPISDSGSGDEITQTSASIGNKDRKPVTLSSSPLHETPPLPSSSPSFSIGNLYLSSCPGKKVRLQGPVKGRSGVCRDLDTDLRRIKALGVGCIICCLDDQELEFLGAPWPEYEERARVNGIDVLRIPTPEGLAPLTPTSLNAHLTRLIDTYTTRGVPMLVHCRGGVGRAGVVACCWLIKLGLCGWVEPDAELSPLSYPSSPSPTPFDSEKLVPRHLSGPGISPPSETNSHVSLGALRHDTVRFVERVIAVVRVRRSMKAVETYEQVKFLVDFVEHLREREAA